MRIEKILILLIWISLYNLISCNSNINYKLEGTHGASDSIKESIERRVFVQSYIIKDNHFRNFKIRESFIEKVFYYGKSFQETQLNKNDILLGKCQFVIILNNNENSIPNDTLRLVLINSKKYSGDKRNKMVCFLDSLDIKDTVCFCVLKKYYEDKDTLGKIIFVKHNNQKLNKIK
jgi:hypothetical protein